MQTGPCTDSLMTIPPLKTHNNSDLSLPQMYDKNREEDEQKNKESSSNDTIKFSDENKLYNVNENNNNKCNYSNFSSLQPSTSRMSMNNNKL
jgi:hypothetical protein